MAKAKAKARPNNPFRQKIRRLKGRAESGDWLRAVHLDHHQELESILTLMQRGGRFNPPGRFPVLHAAEDDERCREGMLAWIREEQAPDRIRAVVVLKVKLARVLDLAQPSTRRALGVTIRQLNGREDSPTGQQIGAAAYEAGFEGIIYPRPLKPRRRNLALFMDRVVARKNQVFSRDDAA
jgi:RES domain-containing protein